MNDMTEWICSSCVLIVGVVSLRRLLRGRISLRLQYALWLVVLLRLLCPVNFFQSSLSIHNVEPVFRPSASHSAAADQPQNSLTDQLPESDSPRDPISGTGNDAEGANLPQTGMTALQPDSTAQTPDSSVQEPVTIPPIEWERVLMTIWAAGAVAMGAFVLGSNVIFTWLLRRTRQDLDVTDCIVPVYTSPAVRTPCLVGLFRPVIYVTQDVAADPDSWKHVLTHELTHLRHGDHLMGVLRCAALVLHWYNPLVWLAVKLIRADGELACDEGTVARLGEQERLDYGRTLIRLTCKSRGPAELMITATTMSDSPDSIRNRIKLIAARPRTLAAALVVCIAAVGVLVGCTFTSAVELDEPEQTLPQETVPVPTAPSETTIPPEETVPQVPDGFVSLNQVLKDEGSEIRVFCEGESILLSEDGLTVELSTDSVIVYRNGFVAAVMKEKPRITDGTVYVHAGFYRDFLCGEKDDQLAAEDIAQPSLFHGVLFFANEILDALDQPESSEFNRKLLAEVLLPTSMGIEAPHIDRDRVFTHDRLSEYPESIRNELTAMGYTNVENYSYSEYLILTGARTLSEANMASFLRSYPELRDADPDEMTVAEFTQWQRDNFYRQSIEELYEEEKDFLAEKNIQMSDLAHLKRIFYNAYMEQTDEALKTALEEYYALDIEYLEGMNHA